MQQVVIDGVEYVPKGTVISPDTMKALGKAYGMAFAEGVYDPACHCICVESMHKVFDLLATANKELGFKK